MFVWRKSFERFHCHTPFMSEIEEEGFGTQMFPLNGVIQKKIKSCNAAQRPLSFSHFKLNKTSIKVI